MNSHQPSNLNTRFSNEAIPAVLSGSGSSTALCLGVPSSASSTAHSFSRLLVKQSFLRQKPVALPELEFEGPIVQDQLDAWGVLCRCISYPELGFPTGVIWLLTMGDFSNSFLPLPKPPKSSLSKLARAHGELSATVSGPRADWCNCCVGVIVPSSETSSATTMLPSWRLLKRPLLHPLSKHCSAVNLSLRLILTICIRMSITGSLSPKSLTLSTSA